MFELCKKGPVVVDSYNTFEQKKKKMNFSGFSSKCSHSIVIVFSTYKQSNYFNNSRIFLRCIYIAFFYIYKPLYIV